MRKNITGIFALLLVAGVYLYRNREMIQRYMADFGIKLPELPETGSQEQKGA